MLDKILLGHNQFFGVNHLDAKTGSKKEEHFAEVEKVMEIISFCFEQDVKGMMMSTHEKAILLAKEIRKTAELQNELGIYLLVPYIAKYVKQANEKGVLNIVKDSLKETSFVDKVNIFMRGSTGVLNKDIRKMITLLIDFEIAPFTNLNLKAVFLHDALTDLAIGWEAAEILELYANHVKDKYKTRPAFCTKNLPRLMKLLNETSIKNPLVMASVNKVGYQVNPSLEAFEKCLGESELELLAMSTLAAGYLKPREAYQYLFSLPRISSVVVGLSSKDHAVETFSEIRSHQY